MIEKKYVHTYIAIVAITIVALYIVQRFNISYPITVRTSSVSSELSVVGEGKIDIVPDTATIDVGVSVTNAQSAPDAQKQIDGVNNKIIEAVKSLGVKKEDITTSNYSIYPNSFYDQESRKETVSGYNGNVTVSIKTKNISLTSQIVDQTTLAGANQIQGIRFSVEHPETYREKARDAAIANAKSQAQKLASSLGIKLGRVTNIVESGSSMPPVMYAMDSKAEAGGGGPQIEPGSQTVVSTVTLYFEKR